MPYFDMICPIKDCNFGGNRDEVVKHLQEVHLLTEKQALAITEDEDGQ